MNERIDLGDGHAMDIIHYKGERGGVNVYHSRPDNGQECVGFISLRGTPWSIQFEGIENYQAWDVQQGDPLTLAPSILCRTCGDHGYIRAGKWERC